MFLITNAERYYPPLGYFRIIFLLTEFFRASYNSICSSESLGEESRLSTDIPRLQPVIMKAESIAAAKTVHFLNRNINFSPPYKRKRE